MKKVIKYPLYLFAILAVLLIAAISYVTLFLPDVGPPPDITVEITDEKVSRGNYLANHVMLCMDCHATRDWTLFSGPPKPGTEGAGGDIFDQDHGFPGRFIAPNITPYALGGWTDGEIFRAITTGVNNKRQALFPLMPWHLYSQLSEEDIRAVIAYLRTLPPIENDPPPSKADFPVNLILNTMPQKANLQPIPPRNNIVTYGKYMITASGCIDCHTRHEKGQFVGEFYAGGMEFKLPDGSVTRSANLTPHETGIGSWTKDQFVERFKAYSDSVFTPHPVQPGDFQTIMPWLMYAGMERYDLEAIYEYLQSLEPVENHVVMFESP